MKRIIKPEMLLSAYAQGIFPMAGERRELEWYSPDPRGIIPLEGFRCPHGLRRALRLDWRISINEVFPEVMRACANREETWIDDCILNSYQELHRLGFAHSVEVWRGDQLAGGLYGVSLGGAFFGESMFHTVRDASKVALYYLVQMLRDGGFVLLDTQWITPHLEQFGAFEMPRDEYLEKLRSAIAMDCPFAFRVNLAP